MTDKINKLHDILKSMGSVLVAYSGGVDSTLLLKAAKDALGGKILAAIAVSASYPDEELIAAKETARGLGADALIIETDEFNDERFLSNPKERCYFCKLDLFSKLKGIAKEKGLSFVAEGSNTDDASDWRPGSRAKEELGVRSPLQEAGFTKREIREASKKLGLPTWDKPSLACLASRIPYGTRITMDNIRMVKEAEKLIKDLGFREVRVRHHGHIARIELGRDEIPKMFAGDMMDDISSALQKIGYMYVTIDLKGYRTGSMNELIKAGDEYAKTDIS